MTSLEQNPSNDDTKAQWKKRLNKRVWEGYYTSASALPPDQGKEPDQRSVETPSLSSVPAALRECVGQAQGKRQKEQSDFSGIESDRDKSSASSTSGPNPLVI